MKVILRNSSLVFQESIPIKSISGTITQSSESDTEQVFVLSPNWEEGLSVGDLVDISITMTDGRGYAVLAKNAENLAQWVGIRDNSNWETSGTDVKFSSATYVGRVMTTTPTGVSDDQLAIRVYLKANKTTTVQYTITQHLS